MDRKVKINASEILKRGQTIMDEPREQARMRKSLDCIIR